MRGRPELEKALGVLGTNDVLVIAEWHRATRSMMDGIKIIQRISERGATVKVLDRQWLDARLERAAEQLPSLILSEELEQKTSIMARLHSRGRRGPLWEYLTR